LSAQSDEPHALIAGAGVGGLTAALALSRRGWRITLLERSNGNEDVGAGLQISPNASAILRGLGILEKITAAGLEPDAIHIRNHRGATLKRLLLEDAGVRWGAPYIDVHRADLMTALREAVLAEANVVFHPQTSVAGFSQTADNVSVAGQHGATRLTFTADCLIGADGVRSQVRARLGASRAVADDLPKRANYVAWRALVPADRVSPALRAPESSLWLGPQAHLVHYPLRGGSTINVVAIVDAFQPLDETADMWSTAGDPADIAKRFARWARPARDLIGAVPDWRLWPLIERTTLPDWHEGRVALLGDAAHAMLPFLAQGAAQAVEDAGTLATCLARAKDIPAALAAYSARRAGRAARVQGASRRQAPIYHLDGIGALIRDTVLRASKPEALRARLDWLYDVRGADQAKL
jgi:salicylate hydroxylase